jgi:hypothetical protein
MGISWTAADQLICVSVTSSNSGIVNVYGSNASSSWSNSDRPKPLKTIGNLTTSISAVQFNHDSQLLAIASKTQKDQMRLVWLILCRSNRLYAYGLISRFTSRPSRHFQTGQRLARRLGTSLASISRQVANTLLLVTLVVVFCYITSKITMHTEVHDDQETSYYVHSLHVSERCAYQVAKAAETSREEQPMRGIDGRAKNSKSTQRYQTEGSVTNRSDS